MYRSPRKMATLQERESSFCDKVQNNSISQALYAQKQSARFCDVIMKVCGREIFAHSCILAAASPYFNAFLSQDLPRQFSQRSPQVIEIQIDGSEPNMQYEEAVACVIDFIYNGNLKVKESNVAQITEIARIMQMDHVVTFCEDFFNGRVQGTVVLELDTGKQTRRATEPSPYRSRDSRIKPGKLVSVSTQVNPTVLGFKTPEHLDKQTETGDELLQEILEVAQCALGEVKSRKGGRRSKTPISSYIATTKKNPRGRPHKTRVVEPFVEPVIDIPQEEALDKDLEKLPEQSNETRDLNKNEDKEQRDDLQNNEEEEEVVAEVVTNDDEEVMVELTDVKQESEEPVACDISSSPRRRSQRTPRLPAHLKDEFFSEQDENMGRSRRTPKRPRYKLDDDFVSGDSIPDLTDEEQSDLDESSGSADKSVTRYARRGKIQCDKCEFKTNKVRQMASHKKLHKLEQNVCYYCDQNFDNRDELTEHLEKHKGPSPYYCPVCDARFKSSTQLNVHLPKHSDMKPYTCPVCDTGFKWKHALTNHMIVHSNKKDHLCDICGYATAHKSQLKAHKLIHTGNTYKCNFQGCSFQATKKQNLKYHLLTHTREKPHQCDICGQAFSLVKNMRRHMLLHSAVKQHQCNQCQFGTTRFDKLREHMLRQHGVGTPPEKRLRIADMVHQNLIQTKGDYLTQDLDAELTEEQLMEKDAARLEEEHVQVGIIEMKEEGQNLDDVQQQIQIIAPPGSNLPQGTTILITQQHDGTIQTSEMSTIPISDDGAIQIAPVDGENTVTISTENDTTQNGEQQYETEYETVMIPANQVSGLVQHVTYIESTQE